MTRLTLHLLGPMSARLWDGERIDFAYDKVRALLAYLAVEHDRAHSRARLAALFWPEKGESAARHSLSQALLLLRQSIGDQAADTPLLRVRRDSVQFNSDADCWVDLIEFNRMLREAKEHDHEEAERCQQCRARFERAMGLCRGQFLEGLSLADSEEFEDWLRARQQSIQLALDQTLRMLISGLEQAGELVRARGFAQRLIDLNPWDESAHRTMMRLLAASGRRAAAIKQYEICRATLEAELGIEPEEATAHLHERIRSGLEGPTRFESVPRRPAQPKSTLPVLATSFIGRDDELQQIRRMIDDGDSRLITLTGPGGIGKTRLAIGVAESMLDQYPDGIHFVPLAGLASPDLLASVILDAIFPQVDRQNDPRRQLLAYLADRNMCLLLDNFEHLLDGSLLVAEMIEAAPRLRILVTSRERLHLTGEWVFEVKGLKLPLSSEPTSIATSAAARLFMLCARKHNASFLPRHEGGPAVSRICHLTGGMPLALELAASWIPVLSPDEIASEIEQSVDFLASSMRDLPARHQSVRAVIDRSWEKLTEVEQRAFRRLSVFHGQFSRAAASYVTGASLPILSALVGKSLLHRDAEGRYEVHQLLRQFGESKLEESEGEADAVRGRHRDFYIGFLAVRQEQLEGKAQEAVLAEISSEIENVRAAWQSAIETRDIRGLSRAAHSLWLFYETTSRYREGATMMGDAFEALRALEDVSPSEIRQHRLALARLRSRQAAFGFRLTGSSGLYQQLDETESLLRSLDEPGEIGLLLNYKACSAHVRGAYEEEERFLLESIEQFERAGHRWGMAYSMNDLGHLRSLKGDDLGARELHQTALGILEELGDRRGVAFALRNLGLVASRLGDVALALALLRRSVEVRRSIGNQWGIAESLNQVGVILRDDGKPAEAKEHFREALQIARDIRAMQLAREILTEYLPLLSAESERADIAPEIHAILPGTTRGDALPIDDGLARLVELVLSEPATQSLP